MLFLTNLPRFYSPTLSISPSSLLPKIKLPLCRATKSTLSTTQPILIPSTAQLSLDTQTEIPRLPTVSEDPQIEIPIEKLFFPPETDVSLENGPLSRRILKGSNIVLSKYASNAQIVQAEFVKSSTNTEACPSDGLPEFALVGRSNVGKSSLLNSIVRRKKLALTSKKPGIMGTASHNSELLPHAIFSSSHVGPTHNVIFGCSLQNFSSVTLKIELYRFYYLKRLGVCYSNWYAAAPQEIRTDWSKFTKDYFLNRSTLVSVFLLVDASIPAKKIDLEYASWLGQNQIPMTLVFTKCDKRKRRKNGGKRAEENVEDFQSLIREFFDAAPPWIMTSSVTNQGRDEILLHMAQLRNYWLKH